MRRSGRQEPPRASSYGLGGGRAPPPAGPPFAPVTPPEEPITSPLVDDGVECIPGPWEIGEIRRPRPAQRVAERRPASRQLILIKGREHDDRLPQQPRLVEALEFPPQPGG